MDSFHDTATHIVSLLDQEDHAEGLVLQIATRNEERSLEAAPTSLTSKPPFRRTWEDSRLAASYAHRFNLYSREHARQAGFDDNIPSIKVAAPVACRVVKSHMPALLPIGLGPKDLVKGAWRSRRGVPFW
eukprot:g16525.t1